MHSPPYERLARATREAESNYPDADRIVPVWAPASEFDVLVEVWQDGRATVVPA